MIKGTARPRYTVLLKSVLLERPSLSQVPPSLIGSENTFAPTQRSQITSRVVLETKGIIRALPVLTPSSPQSVPDSSPNSRIRRKASTLVLSEVSI